MMSAENKELIEALSGLCKVVEKLREEVAELRADRTVHHYHHQVMGQTLGPQLNHLPGYPRNWSAADTNAANERRWQPMGGVAANAERR